MNRLDMPVTTMRRGPLACSGFTLLEALIVLSMLAVLAAAGAPAMLSAKHSVQMGSLAESLVSDLWLARSVGVRRSTRTTICSSVDGLQCDAQGKWSQGWIVFEDRNENGTTDVNEPVIAVRNGMPQGWILSGNSTVEKHVSYTAMGVTKHPSGAFQAGTLTLCKASSVPTLARRIIINSMGRPRVAQVTVDHC